jgi:hypothetical protein
METNMLLCSTGIWLDLDMNPSGSETALSLQANADMSVKLKIAAVSLSRCPNHLLAHMPSWWGIKIGSWNHHRACEFLHNKVRTIWLIEKKKTRCTHRAIRAYINAIALILLLSVLTTWWLNSKNLRLDLQQQKFIIDREMVSRNRLAK